MKMIVTLALSGGLLAMALSALPLAAFAAGAMSTRSSDEELLKRFLDSGQPRLLSYRALLRLEASTRGGRMAASLEAWTYMDAPGRFRFEVIRQDGSALRVDGTLSQRPSWWTRRVDIVRRYTRVSGVRVPVEMSSHADVRFVGDSSFSMTYDYTIDQRSIGGSRRHDRRPTRGEQPLAGCASDGRAGSVWLPTGAIVEPRGRHRPLPRWPVGRRPC